MAIQHTSTRGTIVTRSADSTLTSTSRVQHPGRVLVNNGSMYPGEITANMYQDGMAGFSHVMIVTLQSGGGIQIGTRPVGLWFQLLDTAAYLGAENDVRYVFNNNLSLTTGTPLKVVALYDGASSTERFRVYVDGDKVASGNSTVGTTIDLNGSNLLYSVAAAISNLSSFHSSAHYRRAVTDEEVQEFTANGTYPASPLAFYNFEDTDADTANTLFDSSGNDNTLTVTNAYAGMLANTSAGTSDRNELGYSNTLSIPGQHSYSGSLTHDVRSFGTGDWYEGTFVLHEVPPTDPHTVFVWNSSGGGFGINTSLQVCSTNNNDQADLGPLVPVGEVCTVRLDKMDNLQNGGEYEVRINGEYAGTISTLSRPFIWDEHQFDRNDSTGAPFTHYSSRAWDESEQRFVWDLDFGNSLNSKVDGLPFVLSGAVWPNYVPIDKSGDGTTDIYGNAADYFGRCPADARIRQSPCLVSNAAMRAESSSTVPIDPTTGDLTASFCYTRTAANADPSARPWKHSASGANGWQAFCDATQISLFVYTASGQVTAGVPDTTDFRDVPVRCDLSYIVATGEGRITLTRLTDGYSQTASNIGYPGETITTPTEALGFNQLGEGWTVWNATYNGYKFPMSEGAGNIVHAVGSPAVEGLTVTNPYAGQWGQQDDYSHAQLTGARWVAAGDGATGFITIDPQIPDVGRIEIEVVFATDAIQDVFNHYNATDKYFELDYNSAGTKKVRFTGAGAPNPSVTSSNSVQPGEVATISVNWNNATGSVSITLNGVTTSTTGATWATKLQQDWFIGKRWNSTWFLDGSIHYFRMYDAQVGGNLVYELPLDDGVNARHRARQFTAANSEYFRSTDATLGDPSGGSFWYSCWVYIDSYQPSGSVVCGHWGQSAGSQAGLIFLDGAGGTQYYVKTDAGTRAANGSTLSLGQWYHQFFFWDDTANIVYGVTDTESFVSASRSGSIQNAGEFNIGMNGLGLSQPMDGRIAAAAYGKTPTDTKESIRDYFYNGGRGRLSHEISDAKRTSTGLVEFWDFREQSGDAIGYVNGLDLTDNNTVTSADGPRATQVRETVNGVPGTISGTIDWVSKPLSSGATGNWTRNSREVLDSAEQADVPWAQVKDQPLVFDESNNGNHGTVTGYASPYDIVSTDVPPALAGPLDYSMKFDGAEYLDCGDSDEFSFTDGFQNDTAFSVSTFIKQTSTSGIQGICSKRTDGTGFEWDIESLSNTGRWYVVLWKEGSTTAKLQILTDNAITANTWVHFAMTYDGSGTAAGIKVYFDAVLQNTTDGSTGSYTGMNNTSVPLRWGIVNADPNVALIGYLADNRLYNKELTANEVTYLHTAGASGTDPTTANLVGQWGGSNESFPYQIPAWSRAREHGDAQEINGITPAFAEIVDGDECKDHMHFRDKLTSQEQANLISWQANR